MRYSSLPFRHAILCAILVLYGAAAFSSPKRNVLCNRCTSISRTLLFKSVADDEAEMEETVRLKILGERRKQIRKTIKAADNLRVFRLKNGFVPELDEDGKPITSDGKFAVTLTAFVVAAGAIALRIGGRAALVSAVGLDFVTENPELKENLDLVLNTAESMDPVTKALLFTAAWTAVKVLCFDAAGVALALASGILFGGVLQGAVASAAAATAGSTVAFGLAKLDTPIRRKGLELIDEYPSLRGIEKVVAEDGLKAILTLRLAPLLPIPIGAYNYVYSITNVPLFDFCGGIFLGSLKPYLLDSYLGYFGKSIVDGTAEQSGWQDTLLLAALGASVLIGVFASQLASETWDAVIQEVETEKDKKKEETVEPEGPPKFLGFELPMWVITFQKNLEKADLRVQTMVLDEYSAKLWNRTKDEGFAEEPNPAFYQSSPEILGRNKGVDLNNSVFDGLVLSPILFSMFGKYSDPLYREEEDTELQERALQREIEASPELQDRENLRMELLTKAKSLRVRVENRIQAINERTDALE